MICVPTSSVIVTVLWRKYNMIHLFLLLAVSGIISATDKCPINFCNGTHPSQSEVEHFCQKEANDSSMIGRCCITNETETIIGIDLSSCAIRNLSISGYNFTDIIIMDLRDNELKSLSPHDLIGLLNLTYLYLPYWVSCPGGKEAWNETRLNETYCYLQENPCIYLNISCTDNGDCMRTGPGSAKCICKPGHYGYKCMIEGEFPSTTFAISLTVTTVVLSIVLWFAQGRDAYVTR